MSEIKIRALAQFLEVEADAQHNVSITPALVILETKNIPCRTLSHSTKNMKLSLLSPTRSRSLTKQTLQHDLTLIAFLSRSNYINIIYCIQYCEVIQWFVDGKQFS